AAERDVEAAAGAVLPERDTQRGTAQGVQRLTMVRFRTPSVDEIAAFLRRQADSTFSYPELGATRGVIPSGYNVDRNHIVLGTGQLAFERAKAAVRAWKMFSLPWLRFHWPTVPIEAGANVAVRVEVAGLWFLNGCRVVYVVDEPQRFGFAYGTLLDHAESGEE